MNYKICGIILAKENSNRFPGKNFHEVDGKPMFLHSVDLLSRFIKNDDIYLATNCSPDYLIKYYEKFTAIWRNINACHDEQPYIDMLRTVYMQLPKKYDIIVSVLANSIEHDPLMLKKMISLIKITRINEVRSFNEHGIQSGMFVFKEKVLLDFNTTLHEMGSVIDTGREIHYKEELNERSE
jgi:CMP-N-acetylneuraminic acid synthetase